MAKEKICKGCLKPFVPERPLQSVHDYKCYKKYQKLRKKEKHDKLLKQSGKENDKLRHKADQLLQEKYTYGLCESCGIRQATCCHHYIYKSQSNFLRYSPDNLIRICSECHTRHHKSGDSEIMSRVITKKGIDWENRLQIQRKTFCKLTDSYLKEIIGEINEK